MLAVLLVLSGAGGRTPQTLGASSFQTSADTVYDLVVLGGRVLDPETGLDVRRSISVRAGVIRAIDPRLVRRRP